MSRRGTPAKIDLLELEKLSALQCTDEEIASWFGVSTRTIERRRKVMRFSEVMDRGKAKGRISMRRAQMKMLEAGNATMGVWLGKQYLGQTDEMRHHLDGDASRILIIIPRASSSCSSPVIEATAVGQPALPAPAIDDDFND